MEEQVVALRVDSVSKNFVLPHERADSVKSLFVNPFRSRKNIDEVQHALHDINLEIKKGEFFGIVGRNGSGKSTLLKILAGIYQPSEGSVSVSGRLVPFIELGVGFNPELTGRENVYLNGAMLGFSTKEIDAMYQSIVDFAELEKFMDQKLKNYSSGMQVRLAFSMAVRSEAEILLVDEVLAVGDADFQRKCYDYFKSLKKDKKTVVFVSHDMSAVREFCDRAALIDSSEVKAVGNSSEISDKYNLLFVKDTEEQGDGGTRWGNGAVKLKNLELNKTSFGDDDKEVTLRVTIEAQQDTESLMTGFRVINAAGQCLHETNTWNEDMVLKNLKKGQSHTVIWKCPNIYPDGRYSVDVYVYEQGHTADAWSDALFFRMNRPRFRGFLVKPDIKVSVEK